MAFKFNPFTGTFDIVNDPTPADTYFLSGAVDPQAVAVNAPAGAIYVYTVTGEVYRKTDAGSTTNFVKLVTT